MCAPGLLFPLSFGCLKLFHAGSNWLWVILSRNVGRGSGHWHQLASDAITNENYLTILMKLSESAVGVLEYVTPDDDGGTGISYFNSGEVFIRIFFGVVILVVVLNLVIAKFSTTCE